MQTGIKIGHDQEVIQQTRETIMGIVSAPAGDTVKIEALKALTGVLSIGSVTIHDCAVYGEGTHQHYHQPEPSDDATQGSTDNDA